MPTSYDLADFIKVLRQEFIVNAFGEVRSKKTGKIVRPYIHESRNIFYLRVSLKRKNLLVHKLNFLWQFEDENLLREVIEELESGLIQIDHDDGNSFNNFRGNLKGRPVEENQKKRRSYYKGEK